MKNELFLGIGLIALATLIGSAGALFFKYTSRQVRKNLFVLLKEALRGYSPANDVFPRI
jgi:hypothetical protein